MSSDNSGRLRANPAADELPVSHRRIPQLGVANKLQQPQEGRVSSIACVLRRPRANPAAGDLRRVRAGDAPFSWLHWHAGDLRSPLVGPTADAALAERAGHGSVACGSRPDGGLGGRARRRLAAALPLLTRANDRWEHAQRERVLLEGWALLQLDFFTLFCSKSLFADEKLVYH
jgi:hypothetical protein